MRIPVYKLDSFTTRPFAGNPAAVMLLDAFPNDELLRDLAAENNLAETAFLVRDGDEYRIRWFTPVVEVPLCGHATLASAAVVMERLERGRRSVVFQSLSGPLPVRRTDTGYIMDFPARFGTAIETPGRLTAALGLAPTEVLENSFNYLAALESAHAVRVLVPDLTIIASLDRPGLIVTGPGDGEYDFTSRYFAPQKGIPEDPVTGGAHCMLAPYWATRLGRTSFRAYQASARGGEMRCTLSGVRVELEGSCVFYLQGEVDIPTTSS